MLKRVKKRTCNCRRRKPGNPKIGCGICYLSFDYRPAVRQRIEGKRLVKRWLRGDEE
jgi:hypothetical protein